MASSLAAAGARGGMVTILAQLVSLATRLVGMVFLARLLPPEVFGLAAVVSSITAFASAVIFLGLPMATVQASTLSQRAKSSLFIVNSVLGVTLAAFLFIAAPYIAAWYGQPPLEMMLRWLALVPLLSGMQSQFRLQLIRSLRFTGLAVVEVLAQLAATVVAIVLALQGKTYEAVVAQGLVQSGISIIMVVALSRWVPTWPGAWASEVRDLLLVGLRIFGTNLLRDGSRNVVVPVMAVFNSPNAVGNFDRAQQLSVIPINLTVDQLQRVAIPILSQFRDDPDKMLAYMRRAQLAAAYVTASGFLVVAAIAQPLVVLVLGAEWTLAGTILQVMAVGAVFRTLGQSMQWIFISAGATKEGLIFSVWSQPAIVFLTLLGLPWGVLGVAVANSLAWALYWPIATGVAAKAARFDGRYLITDALRAFGLFAFPVGLGALVALCFGLGDIPTVLLAILFAVVAGVLSYLIFKPVRRDLQALFEVLRLALRRQR